MPLAFLEEKIVHDADAGEVRFEACDETGRVVQCAIPDVALLDFTCQQIATNAQLVGVFMQYRSVLQEVGEERYYAGLFEDDGRIIIQSKNLQIY